MEKSFWYKVVTILPLLFLLIGVLNAFIGKYDTASYLLVFAVYIMLSDKWFESRL